MYLSSDNVLEDYSVLLKTSILRVAKVDIPAAEVILLNTTRKIIVPAVLNKIHLPFLFRINKKSGAYTAGTATGVRLKWETAVASASGNIPIVGVLDSALETAYQVAGLGIGTVQIDASNVNGSALSISIDGGNVSGAGGALVAVLYYYTHPIFF